MTILARQRLDGLWLPLIIGFSCIGLSGIALLAIRPMTWMNVVVAVWFTLCGGAIFLIGLKSWHPRGVGLLLHDHGILWNDVGKMRLLPWDAMAGAKLVSWRDEGEEMYGVVIGLQHEIETVFSGKQFDLMSAQIKQKFADLPWARVLMLSHEHWDWNPHEIVRLIEDSVKNSTTG